MTSGLPDATVSPESPARLDQPPLQQRMSLADALLLGAILLIMLWGIGGHGLYEPHEGHFAGVGREMVTSGDWITPNLNGAPYLNKPPLFYWMIALSYTIFGTISEFAARVPLALTGWCGVVLAWSWARQLFGPAAGRCAAVMLSVSAGWYLFCHQLIIDPLLSVLLLAASYTFWRALQPPESRRRWIEFYAVCGLAAMAKGPIGVAFPAIVFVGYMVWRRDWNLLLRAQLPLGALVIALIVAPWCIALEIRNPGSMQYMLINENFKRAIDERWPPDYDVVKVSMLKYVGIAMVWMAPWSLLLLQTSSFAWKKSRMGEKQEATRPIADAMLILILSVLIPIAFFLPMKSRLVYYCLPSVPPMAVLAAGWWTRASEPCYVKGRVGAGFTFLILGGAIFSAAFWVPGLLAEIPQVKAMPTMKIYIAHLSYALGVALMFGGVLLLFKRELLSMATLAVILSATQLYNLQGFAEFDGIWSSRQMMAQLTPLIAEDVIWISEGSKEIGAAAGTSYYLGQDKSGKPHNVLVMKDSPGRQPPKFPGDEPRYLIDKQKLAELWASEKPVVYVTDFHRGDWVNDPPSLPAGVRHEVDTNGRSGNRRVYANDAAWERLQSSGK